jgi:hypothetical protein
VDGLFMSLILLSLSGAFFLNILLEVSRMRRGEEVAEIGRVATASAGPSADGVVRESGLVERVDFFEAPVGQQNRSIVTLRPRGANGTRVIVFYGDLRNRLPANRRFQLTYRAEGPANVLIDAN